MDFSLNENQEMLKTSARDFLEKECPMNLVREMMSDEKGYSSELWSKMAGLGWMGLPFPVKYGGEAGDFLDLTVLLEEMGRTCLPGPFFSSVVLGGLTLLQAANEEQKEKFLPQVSKGCCILTLALTESSAKYTADSIEVRASPNRGIYEIDGTKLFVPDAHIADFIICAAKSVETIRSEEGITLFIVEGKSPGITCNLLRTMAGDNQCEVIFNKVCVPEENIVGGLNQGWPYIEQMLQKAVVAKCAEMVGGAQKVLELVVDYAKERVQFERPIGSFQAIQHYCADMAIDIEGCRWITYQAAWMLKEGLSCAKEVAMAKAWVSQAYPRVTTQAIQCFGAIATTEDHDMGLYFKRAKASESVLGNEDFHLETVAREAGFA